jgi:invasion protein IalB
MKFHHTMVLATAIALAVVPGAVAQNTTANAPKPEKYKDWDLLCARRAAGAPEVCEMLTVILSDKGQRLGALVVAAQVGTKEVIASALLPLGVDLTQTPSLAVGASKIDLQYMRCQQRGCEAMGKLSADQQAALRAGSTAKVAVGVGPGKMATFDFSLAGFSAAHDAFRKRIGAL